MDDRPENRSTLGQTTFAWLPVLSVVVVCVIVILMAFGVATWWGPDSPAIDRSTTLRESSAGNGAAAGFSGVPPVPSVQTAAPASDDRPAQTDVGLPPAVEAARSDQADAETAALRANPPTLLDAMMRAQTEQGKPGQMPREGAASSTVSPFRHDQGGSRQ